MTSLTRTLTCLLALTLTLSTIGCSAKDKHTFVSTVSQPTTIVLLDTYQSQAVWEMDIPVNHKLVLDFEGTASGQSSEGTSPSWVNWKLYRADDLPTNTGRARKGTLIDSDRVDLTGKKILMQSSFRPAPEIPGSVDAAPVPVQKSTQAVAEEAIAETKAMEPEAPAVEEATMEAVEQANEEAIEAVEEVAPAIEEEAAEAVEVVEEAATQPTK